MCTCVCVRVHTRVCACVREKICYPWYWSGFGCHFGSEAPGDGTPPIANPIRDSEVGHFVPGCDTVSAVSRGNCLALSLSLTVSFKTSMCKGGETLRVHKCPTGSTCLSGSFISSSSPFPSQTAGAELRLSPLLWCWAQGRTQPLGPWWAIFSSSHSLSLATQSVISSLA